MISSELVFGTVIGLGPFLLFSLNVLFFQEAKPSTEDLGDKKEGEYIKLKVIGQVSFIIFLI